MKKIIYTAIIGNYDDLKKPIIITEGWRYICFTDNQSLRSDFWEIIHIKKAEDNKRLARKIKIKSIEFLPTYDICIWIDGSIQINCNLDEFVSKLHADLSIIKHHVRDSILEEAEICKMIGKDAPETIDKQMEFYRADKYEFNNGLVESGLIIRKNTPTVNTFCDLWFEQIEKFSIRDQLSFNYVLYKYPIKLELLDYSVLYKEFILNNHLGLAGGKIENPLKVIITGMEHSGTGFLRELILKNSSLINSGSECGVLLSETPKTFQNIEPFYNWLCEENHGWSLTKEQRDYVCDTDSFNEFYTRLIRISPLFKNGTVYLLDETPAYSYFLSDIIKKTPNTPIVIIVRDIESLWYDYKERGFTFEEFIERYIRFKTSLLTVVPNEHLKIIRLDELKDFNIKKLEEVFLMIQLSLRKTDLISKEEWATALAGFNFSVPSKNASESVDGKQKLILNEIEINASVELNKKGQVLKKEQALLAAQTEKYETLINEVRSKQLVSLKLKNILVSVIIPNFNYAPYIEECLKSVLNSDFPSDKLEIIVVDDNSTDDSVNIIEQLTSNVNIRNQLIKNNTNIGLAKARNLAIKNAHGEFLFILDSDNYITPECLKKHSDFLIENPEYTACFAPIQRFENDTRKNLLIFSNTPFSYSKLADGNYIDAMSMIRKSDLMEIGLYDEKMPAGGWEDYELWLRMGKANKKVHLIEGTPLSFYRSHSDSMINSVSPLSYELLITYLKATYPINEKRLKSLFCKTDHINLQISNPLSDVFVQLFYSNNETNYTEDRSLGQHVTITNSLATISFNLQANNTDTKFIHFNFDHFAGLILIHTIKIKTTNGELLRAFDGDVIYDKINGAGAINAENRNLLSGFINPKFTIAFEDIIQNNSSAELIIDLLISGVDPSQMDALTKLSTVLFARYQQNLGTLQQANANLSNDLQGVSHELNSAKENIQALSSTNNTLIQQVKEKELAVIQIETEKSAIIADKLFLVSELKEKNELINQALKAKEDAGKILLQKNEQITVSEGKLAIFEQLISSSKRDISSLQDEKLSLSKEIERVNLKLVEGEQALQRKSEKIHETEKALINKEFIVSNLENEKQRLEHLLSELAGTVDEKTTKLIELESKISTQIELSQNTLEMKEERHFSELEAIKNELKWYQNAYENKTIVSILKAKLFKLKMLYFSRSKNNKTGNGENDHTVIQSLFDTVYYLEANPDVKKAGVKPLHHYSTTGWREGRNPNALFDVIHYLETNPDVKNAGVEPFQHYLTFGWKEGRNPSPLFDVKYYLESNPDVQKNSIEPLFHYLTHGWREKRNPNPLFDVNYYLETNKDIKTTSIEPLYHYLTHGWREGRNPSQSFDTLSYLSKYPDIERAGVNPLVHYIKTLSQENGHIDLYAPVDHHTEVQHHQAEQEINHPALIENIIHENAITVNHTDSGYTKDELIIKASEWFDAAWYAANYKLESGQDPAKHYTHVGWKMLYNPSDKFSTAQYLLLNKDVETTGGNPLIHYELFGKAEPNRIYHEPHVIDYDLNIGYKKQQDAFLSANYNKSVKKLVVYLVPEIDSISGGIMSICSMARVTKNIEELSDTTILVATLPSVTTFFQYSKFDAGFNVLRFDQLREYFTELEEMTIHIPEIYVYYFLLKIKPVDADWLRRLKKNQLNILNQNMALMPRLKVVEYLKMFGHTVTITCAHKRYCTKQLRSSYDVPVHFFSTSNLVKYKYKSYVEKENIIAYSPDDNPFKNDILSLLQKAFPKYTFLEIRNMSYEQYLSTITKAKFMITFGEGIDGYFVESIRSGSIPFSVRNYLFFDENFNNYSNIYESYFDMLGKIVTDMKGFENEKKYNSFNSELRALDARVYNDEEYKNNIKDYYLKKYSFPIEKVHQLRKERQKSKPLISITMATYNGEAYLEKQLNSLLSQTYKNTEIIVSDDNSTDATPTILQHYKEKYGITVVTNKGEKGLNGNFSTALKLAKGEYISLCDQDDIWESNKLEVLLERIDDFDIVQGQMVIIDEHDQYHPAQYMHDAYETDKTSLFSIENYIKENPMLGCATLITRRCIEQSLPVPEGFVYHDWWIVLNAILKGNGICNVDIPIIKYRQHSSNTAKSNFWSTSWCQKKYVSDKIITKKMDDYLNPSAKHLLECDMNLMLLYGFARKFAPKLAFEYFDSNSTAFSNSVVEKMLEHINLKTEEDLKYEK